MELDTSRMTPLQVKMHHDRIRLQEKAQTKIEFEESLRNSVSRTTNSGSALFGANRNMFQTDLAKDSAKLISLNKRKHIQKEKMIDMITERHPLKKFLNPNEVADLAEFLLSEKSASISGQVFNMDCGIVSFKI